MEGLGFNIVTTIDIKNRLSISCKVLGKDYWVNICKSSLYNVYSLTPVTQKLYFSLKMDQIFMEFLSTFL